MTPDSLCASVHNALALRQTPALLHDGIEELLLGERLRSRHVGKRVASEELVSQDAKRCALPSSVPSQMTRSQSALQIPKMASDEAASLDTAPAITASPAVPMATNVSAVPQMRRSQSALQIPKLDETERDAPYTTLSHGTPCAAECSPRKITTTSTGSAPPTTPPVDSQMKRSQSALQIPKMGRIGSCGSLAELAAAGALPLNVA